MIHDDATERLETVNTMEEVPARPASPTSRPFMGYGLAFFFATIAFFSGMQVGGTGIGQGASASVSGFFFPAPAPKEDVDLSLFWRVWHTLDERFVGTHATSTDPKPNEEHVWGAIEGLVQSYGDPYTVFMPPKDTELFEASINGEFGGIGMEVGMQKEVITVIAPLPDSPAMKAGILSGDIIVKINDESTENMNVDEAVLKIRGEKGTTVHLTLYREGEEELLELDVMRDTIIIPTLKTEEKDGVFIIRLYNFSATSESLMQGALREFVRSGTSGLIIDLRGNPGGFLQSAVSIASYFLPTGTVVVRESFGGEREEGVHRSTGKNLGKKQSFKVAVLIDGGSASASEILAGALREHGVAKLIGMHTFGKGSVQELVDMPDGSSLKVTIARWLTPNGTSISEGGLKPDIEVELTKEDREAKKDPQLEAAIKYVKEK